MNNEQLANDTINDLSRKLAQVQVSNSILSAQIAQLSKQLEEKDNQIAQLRNQISIEKELEDVEQDGDTQDI